MLVFTCGEGDTPRTLQCVRASHQPQALTLPPTAGGGGGWPPAEQGWGFLKAVRGCSWGREYVRGRRAASVLGARHERLEGISHPVLARGSAFMNAAGI